MSGRADVLALVSGARSGRARDLARLITLVENGSSEVPALMRELGSTRTDGEARVVGLTGAPGVGKSTTTSALIAMLRARGERVAVLAVDPSSPFSGGALLGDRIRMQEHATDPDVFIRSMATRGHLGGLAATTPQAIRVLESVGFDTVLVETVGVGQSEVEIVGAADTTVVLLAPGMGDSVQAAKAGILEIGDVFVVNKADRDGVASTVRELRAMIALGTRPEGGWTPAIVTTIASRAEGIGDLVDALDAHRHWLVDSGELDERRFRRARDEVAAIALGQLRRRLSEGAGSPLDAAAREVAAGRDDAFSAAAALVRSIIGE